LQAFRASCALHLTQMVNVGFPEKTRYGFEMVDAADALPHFWRRRDINRDFMADQTSRNFGEF